MRRIRFPLALLAAALLPGAECFDLDSLIDEDALGIPDPCDSPEIACNGIDEDCDGVDDCAEVPEEALQTLRWALGFAEHDCAGIDGLRASYLSLDAGLPRDAACPAVTVEADAGPLWDGNPDCGEAGADADSCERSGESLRETLAGSCTTEDGLAVSGTRAAGQGALRIDLVREGALQRTEVEGSDLLAEDWRVEGDEGVAAAYSGDAGRTRRTVSSFGGAAADSEPLSVFVADGCALTLTLPAAVASGSDEVVTDALALGGQDTTEQAGTDPETYERSAQGNFGGLLAQTRVAGEFVRTRQGDEESCRQEGEVVVEGSGEAGEVSWRLRLELDRACELCGTLRLDGEAAGEFCSGQRRVPGP